ncbi:LacI family DNA-binding transcriptional regulator [Caballeronia sp. INDeC2]|uniref:LacI family DNA-binding transcriptional regulator n=1 Tax=Caballeronia sp. INDeC2 TaxID=2921747 RepID=UPI002028D0E3|nr:LacI family DNA-binding transcriptional regulator [Caballeronia sp. INDeC2]
MALTKPLSPRTPRATSYDVALAAGVSQSTVSRCFQGDPRISADTRAQVLRVAEQLGYRPNSLARSLILGQSDVVGVIVTKYTLRFNPDVLYAIGEQLAAHGVKLLLIAVDDDASVHHALRDTADFPLDGLISCASMQIADIESFQRHGVPVVFVNRQSSFKGVDSVSTDNASSAYELADALYGAGHRRFLCIGGPDGAPVSDARIDAFVARLRERDGISLHLVHSDFSYDQGYAMMLEHGASSKAPFEAVFCANDQIALGVLDACRFELGLSIPSDISIVGFDDIPEAGRPTYQLTTIRQHVDRLAAEAIRLLSTRREAPKLKRRAVVVPGVLVARASARLIQP